MAIQFLAFTGTEIIPLNSIGEGLSYPPGTFFRLTVDSKHDQHIAWKKCVDDYSWNELKEVPENEVPKAFKVMLLLLDL